MDRLSEIVIFTGDLAGMRRFYEEQVGLVIRVQRDDWVSFDTAGATLALSPASDPTRRGVHIRFATDDIEARVRDLSARGAGIDSPIEKFPWGRLASFRDAENNPLAFWEPSEPHQPGGGLSVSAAINCRDMEAQKHFYRDQLGLDATLETPWWVQLAAGDVSLGLHPRGAGGGVHGMAHGTEGHHAHPVTIGLSVEDLRAWHGERSAMGLRFASPPTDRGYGTFADAFDPDGNPVSFREMADEPEPETIEEQLAEPFEADQAPRTAMRKPVHKRAKATSRVATRPQYRSSTRPARRKKSAKAGARVASARGAGPAGTRKKPKRKHDSKRARAKPAIGRLRKAERKTFKSQKQAIAGASKRKPVKRASRARVAKRGAARSGSGRR
jgi:predicted enzyme related to lactoylglutathione lyase